MLFSPYIRSETSHYAYDLHTKKKKKKSKKPTTSFRFTECVFAWCAPPPHFDSVKSFASLNTFFYEKNSGGRFCFGVYLDMSIFRLSVNFFGLVLRYVTRF